MSAKAYRSGILGVFLLGLLSSCSQDDSEAIEALNQRIDQLEVSSEEVLIRANSMYELELVVAAMEARQEDRLRQIIKRETRAKARVIQIEAEIAELEQKSQDLQGAAEAFEKQAEPKLSAARKVYTELLKSAEQGEEMQAIVAAVEQLVAENNELNEKLKAATTAAKSVEKKAEEE